jgi:hypothetical protein
MAAAAAVVVAAAWGVWSYVEARDGGVDEPPARTPAETLQRELIRQNIGQAGDSLLTEMYERINQRHFGHDLPSITIRWEPRLAEVGALVAESFTLQGIYGHVGRRSVILLNPGLQGDEPAIARTLSHEIVHVHLQSTGDQDVNHGPRFQNVLRRIAGEGAFAGPVSTNAERTRLRDWLDAESVRLDEERAALDRLGAELESDRLDVERAMEEINKRQMAAAKAQRGRGQARGRGRGRGQSGPSAPSAAEIEAVTIQRDAYNERVRLANEQMQRHRDGFAYFNREVARHNLMLVYPDGLDAWALVQPKATPAPAR